MTVPSASWASEPQRQLGAAPLHAPFAWQVRVAGPSSAEPVPQSYVAVLPYVVPSGVVTVPFVGAGSVPQSTSVSHSAPVKPSGQVHVDVPFAAATHAPPFWQGFVAHGSGKQLVPFPT